MALTKMDVVNLVNEKGIKSVYMLDKIPQDFICEYSCYLSLPFLYVDGKLSTSTFNKFKSQIEENLGDNLLNNTPIITEYVNKYFPGVKQEVVYTSNEFDRNIHSITFSVINMNYDMKITVGQKSNSIMISGKELYKWKTPKSHSLYLPQTITNEDFVGAVNRTIFHLFN